MSNSKRPDESISRIVFWPFWFAGRFLVGMLFLSIFALIIAIWVHKAQYEFSLDGVKQPVTPAYMVEVNRRSMEHSANAWLSDKAANAMYVIYFKMTGVHALALNPTGQGGQGFLARAVEHNPDAVAVAMLAARLFGIRAANVILSLPLILLVVMLASVDGLTERIIRRECGGHESDTQFRVAKKFAYTLLPPVVGLVYLCLPMDISLGAVLLPALIITAVLVRTKLKYYKKYI